MNDGWELIPMGQVCSISSGDSDTQDAVDDGAYAFFDRSRSIKRSSRFLYDCEALIIPGEGKEFLPRHFIGKFDLHQRAYALFDFSEQIYPRFLYFYLHHFRHYLPSVAVGATVKSIRRRHFEQLPVAITALSEQQRIVDILEEAFDGIATAKANAEKNLQNARALFDSHLEFAFGVCGTEWKETLLQRVLKTQPQNGWSPPAANHSDSGIPVLTLSSVTGFQFRPEKIKYTSVSTDARRHYWVSNDDLLISRSNTPLLVGHVAIASGINTPTVYPDLIMRMNPNSEQVVTRFLWYQLRTRRLRNEIMGRAQGANPTMKKIDKQAVQTLAIAVPSLKTQTQIVDQLDNAAESSNHLATIYQRKLDALEALKKSLLHQAFTGEL